MIYIYELLIHVYRNSVFVSTLIDVNHFFASRTSDPHRNSVFVSTLIDVNHVFASRRRQNYDIRGSEVLEAKK
jgi:hypothetical protein